MTDDDALRGASPAAGSVVTLRRSNSDPYDIAARCSQTTIISEATIFSELTESSQHQLARNTSGFITENILSKVIIMNGTVYHLSH